MNSKFNVVGQEQIKLLSVWLERSKNEPQRKRPRGTIGDAIHRVANSMAKRQKIAASKLF